MFKLSRSQSLRDADLEWFITITWACTRFWNAPQGLILLKGINFNPSMDFACPVKCGMKSLINSHSRLILGMDK